MLPYRQELPRESLQRSLGNRPCCSVYAKCQGCREKLGPGMLPVRRRGNPSSSSSTAAGGNLRTPSQTSAARGRGSLGQTLLASNLLPATQRGLEVQGAGLLSMQARAWQSKTPMATGGGAGRKGLPLPGWDPWATPKLQKSGWGNRVAGRGRRGLAELLQGPPTSRRARKRGEAPFKMKPSSTRSFQKHFDKTASKFQTPLSPIQSPRAAFPPKSRGRTHWAAGSLGTAKEKLGQCRTHWKKLGKKCSNCPPSKHPLPAALSHHFGPPVTQQLPVWE